MRDRVDELLRQTTTSTVLLVQLVLVLATVLAAWLLGWRAAVTGLALLHLVTVVATLGPWRDRAHRAATATRLSSVEDRLDALSTRVVAGTERTRVDILAALPEPRETTGDRRP